MKKIVLEFWNRGSMEFEKKEIKIPRRYSSDKVFGILLGLNKRIEIHSGNFDLNIKKNPLKIVDNITIYE